MTMSLMEKELLLKQLIAQNSTGAVVGRGIADIGGTALGFADGLVSPAATRMQQGLVSGLTGIDKGASVAQFGNWMSPKANVLRMAGSPATLRAMKVGVGVGALGGVLGAADILAGQDSGANKVMDATAMTIGGLLGAAGGPMGIAAGAGVGKTVSDATQWLFGDKKSAEERRMEEALLALRGGQI